MRSQGKAVIPSWKQLDLLAHLGSEDEGRGNRITRGICIFWSRMNCAVVTDKAGNDINNHNGTTLWMLTSNVSLRAAQRPDLETKGITLVQVLKSFSYKHPVQDNARCLLQYGINIRLKRVLSFFLFLFLMLFEKKKSMLSSFILPTLS